jgi:hypothetical protein
VTVVADAGVGKSRLNEAVRQAATIRDDDSPDEAVARLRAIAGENGHEVVERIAAAIGLSDAQFPIDELFWGTRRRHPLGRGHAPRPDREPRRHGRRRPAATPLPEPARAPGAATGLGRAGTCGTCRARAVVRDGDGADPFVVAAPVVVTTTDDAGPDRTALYEPHP